MYFFYLWISAGTRTSPFLHGLSSVSWHWLYLWDVHFQLLISSSLICYLIISQPTCHHNTLKPFHTFSDLLLIYVLRKPPFILSDCRKKRFFIRSSICEPDGENCKTRQKIICHQQLWLEPSHQLESCHHNCPVQHAFILRCIVNEALPEGFCLILK